MSRRVSGRERPGSIKPANPSSMPMVSRAAAGRRLDDGTDDGIEAGGVPAAGQQSDAHADIRAEIENRHRASGGSSGRGVTPV